MDRYKTPQCRNNYVVTRNTPMTTTIGTKIVTIMALGKVPMVKFITANLYLITKLCYDGVTSVTRVAATSATTPMD